MKTLEYKKILIVEDDKDLRASLAAHFSVFNEVTSCGKLSEAVDALNGERYDIILLDLILPDGSGLKLFDYSNDIPVVILSDLSSDGNLIEGFSAGAADYIVKPASLELIEMRMSLRLLPGARAKISAHGLELDCGKRTAVFRKKPLELTSSEFNILLFLMQNAGKYFTANEIYEQVWKMPHLNSTTIKAHLSNLRKKMLAAGKACSDLIVTGFGKGYSFSGGNNE